MSAFPILQKDGAVSNFVVKKNLVVNEKLTTPSIVSSNITTTNLNVNEKSTISGDCDVQGNLSVGKSITGNGDTDLQGNLQVEKSLVLNGLSNSTKSNVLYFDTTSKSVSYGPAPTSTQPYLFATATNQKLQDATDLKIGSPPGGALTIKQTAGGFAVLGGDSILPPSSGSYEVSYQLIFDTTVAKLTDATFTTSLVFGINKVPDSSVTISNKYGVPANYEGTIVATHSFIASLTTQQYNILVDGVSVKGNPFLQGNQCSIIIKKID